VSRSPTPRDPVARHERRLAPELDRRAPTRCPASVTFRTSRSSNRRDETDPRLRAQATPPARTPKGAALLRSRAQGHHLQAAPAAALGGQSPLLAGPRGRRTVAVPRPACSSSVVMPGWVSRGDLVAFVGRSRGRRRAGALKVGLRVPLIVRVRLPMIGLAPMAQPRTVATGCLLATLSPARQRAGFAGRLLNPAPGGLLIAGSGFEVGGSLGADSWAPIVGVPARIGWRGARARQWACPSLSCEHGLAVRWIAALPDTSDAAATTCAPACAGSPTASRAPRNTATGRIG
jgi:hypothetical protein